MDIEKIKEAYSSGNDEALCKELASFHLLLINQSYLFGPAVVAWQFHSSNSRFLLSILNKIGAVASSGSVAERLAYQAGAVNTYLDYFQDIAKRLKVDEAYVRLFDNQDEPSPVRIMILKMAYSHSGMRTKTLIDTVSRMTRASKSLVENQIRQLLELRLVEKIKWKIETGHIAVYYRITRLGEAVLARHSQPHELALFCVDEAASDAEMRAAMRQEIKDTWPLEDLTVPDAELRVIAAKRDELSAWVKKMIPENKPSA